MIKWTDQYRLGIPEIDQQHKEFFSLLNKLDEAELENLTEVVQAVEDYAKFHFETEEKLMAETNFPELKTHKVSHKVFIDQLKSLKKMTTNSKDELKQKLFEFMSNWVLRHILVVDCKYRSHFYKNGLCVKEG